MRRLVLFLCLVTGVNAGTGGSLSDQVASLQLEERQLHVDLARVKADLALAEAEANAPERPRPLDATVHKALTDIAPSPGVSPDNLEIAENTENQPYYPQLLGDTAYAKAVRTIERSRVWKEKGELIRSLGRTPGGMEQLADLLTEESMCREDLTGMTVPGKSEVKSEARQRLIRQWRRRLAAAFGTDAVTAEHAFAGTVRLREALDSLQIRLSYTDQPLTQAQYARLLALVEEAVGPRVTSRYWLLPDEVVASSASVLSGPQRSAFREVQEERNALKPAHSP